MFVIVFRHIRNLMVVIHMASINIFLLFIWTGKFTCVENTQYRDDTLTCGEIRGDPLCGGMGVYPLV